MGLITSSSPDAGFLPLAWKMPVQSDSFRERSSHPGQETEQLIASESTPHQYDFGKPDHQHETNQAMSFILFFICSKHLTQTTKSHV